MLMAVAARSSMSQSIRDSPSEGSTPASAAQEVLAAWSAARRRRCVLTLCDGESLALVGKGSGNALRWWCAQLLARNEVRVTVLDDPPGVPQHERAGHRDSAQSEGWKAADDRLGLRLAWGPQAHPRSAQIVTCSHDEVPPQALSTRPAPAGAPSYSPTWWEAVRHLSRSRITEPPGSSSRVDGVPDVVPLKAVMDDLDAHELRARWEEQTRSPARGAPALSAVLGVGAQGPVRADLVADGPHALLAGTTGSGKSELLISWLVQLALSRAPDHLTLVLVDYKGGAAFGPLADLPHTAGVLTDLDPAGTQRALSSLEAEVRRRERILAAHGAKDLSWSHWCVSPPRGAVWASTSFWPHSALRGPCPQRFGPTPPCECACGCSTPLTPGTSWGMTGPPGSVIIPDGSWSVEPAAFRRAPLTGKASVTRCFKPPGAARHVRSRGSSTSSHAQPRGTPPRGAPGRRPCPPRSARPRRSSWFGSGAPEHRVLLGRSRSTGRSPPRSLLTTQGCPRATTTVFSWP